MTPYIEPIKDTKEERTPGVTLSYVSLAAIVAAGALIMKLLSALNVLSEMLRGIVN